MVFVLDLKFDPETKMTDSHLVLSTSSDHGTISKYANLLATTTNESNQIQSPTSSFIQPSTKLEQIESCLIAPSLELNPTKPLLVASSNNNNYNNNTNNTSNNVYMLANNGNTSSSSSNNLYTTIVSANTNNNINNSISALLLFDADNKIISLQRSISDKLRNSFKSNGTNTSPHTNSTKQPVITTNLTANNNGNKNGLDSNANTSVPSYPILTLTRKWHSERYKNKKILINNVNTNSPKQRYSIL
jgi:hypothetical protein